MNPKTTRFLVVLAIGLFCYIFFFERSRPNTAQKAVLAKRLIADFDPATVASVQVVFPTNQIIQVDRTNNAWRMVQPVRYPAESQPIEELLSAIQQAQQIAAITASELKERGGLATFGLDNPPVTLVFLRPSGRTELRLAIAPGNGSRLYAQFAGGETIYALDPGLARLLPVNQDGWRNRTLLDLSRLNPDRLVLTVGAQNLEFERDPAAREWRMSKPIRARADLAQIEEFLRQMQSARVMGFGPDKPAPADLEIWGLQPAEVEASFSAGTNAPTSIKFGHSLTNAPEVVFALRSENTNVVGVSRELVQRARDLFTHPRDSRLVTVRSGDLDRIEFTGAEKFVLQRSGTNAWQFIEPQIPADVELVHALLNRLIATRSADAPIDVVTDYASYGLQPPAFSYRLLTVNTNAATGATNQLLVQLDFGKTEGGKTFVRRSDESTVYAVRLGETPLAQAAWELRDRRIWNFNSTNVVSIEISQNGKTRKLVHNPNLTWSSSTGPLDQIAGATLDYTLRDLGDSRAERWLARGEDQLGPAGITAAQHRVTFEIRGPAKNELLTLDLGVTPNGIPCGAARLEGQTLIFELSRKDYVEMLRDLTIP